MARQKSLAKEAQCSSVVDDFFDNKNARAQGLWASEYVLRPLPISRGGRAAVGPQR